MVTSHNFVIFIDITTRPNTGDRYSRSLNI